MQMTSTLIMYQSSSYTVGLVEFNLYKFILLFKGLGSVRFFERTHKNTVKTVINLVNKCY